MGMTDPPPTVGGRGLPAGPEKSPCAAGVCVGWGNLRERQKEAAKEGPRGGFVWVLARLSGISTAQNSSITRPRITVPAAQPRPQQDLQATDQADSQLPPSSPQSHGVEFLTKATLEAPSNSATPGCYKLEPEGLPGSPDRTLTITPLTYAPAPPAPPSEDGLSCSAHDHSLHMAATGPSSLGFQTSQGGEPPTSQGSLGGGGGREHSDVRKSFLILS